VLVLALLSPVLVLGFLFAMQGFERYMFGSESTPRASVDRQVSLAAAAPTRKEAEVEVGGPSSKRLRLPRAQHPGDVVVRACRASSRERGPQFGQHDDHDVNLCERSGSWSVETGNCSWNCG